MQKPQSMKLLPLTLFAAITSLALAAGCGGSEASSSRSSGSGAQSGEQQTVGGSEATTSTSSPETPTHPSTNTGPSSGGASSGGAAREETSSGGASSGGEPAFVQPTKVNGEGLAGAEAALRAHGYTPVESSTYKPQQTLRVLVGSGDGGEHAFFFVGNRYIGVDSKSASTHVTVSSQNEGSVTLRYSLYSHGQPAGSAAVTFALEDGSLQPRRQIPPAAQRTLG